MPREDITSGAFASSRTVTPSTTGRRLLTARDDCPEWSRPGEAIGQTIDPTSRWSLFTTHPALPIDHDAESMPRLVFTENHVVMHLLRLWSAELV